MSHHSFNKWTQCGFFLLGFLTTIAVQANDDGLPVQPDLYVEQIQLTRNSLTSMTTVEVTAGNSGLALGRRQPAFLQILTGADLQNADVLETMLLHSTSGGDPERIAREYTDELLNENLFVRIDPFNDIFESNENNNVISASVQSAKIVDGDTELKIDVVFDGDSSQILVDSLARFVISAAGFSSFDENPFAVIAIENESGDDVYRTGELPLLLDDINSKFRGEFYWSTLGLEAGQYSILTTIKNSNGTLALHRQIVTLMSLNANQAPVAADDEAYTVMDQSLVIDLILNDFEPDGDRLETYISQNPTYGIATELRGIASYRPAPGFVGIDEFMYQLDDTRGGSDWAKVRVNVYPREFGCTWVRDYASPLSGERVAIDGWSDYELPISGVGEFRSSVLFNDNPDLFDEQPFISFPSCSLYYTAKPGASGTATVTYVVVDKETKGKLYRSEERQFTLSIQSAKTLPTIISIPDTYMEISDVYHYKPMVDIERPFELFALSLPDFLEVKGGELVLAEKPSSDDIGLHDISLVLDFGDVSVKQNYWLTLTPDLATGSEELIDNLVLDDQNTHSPNDNTSADTTGRSGSGFPSVWLISGLLIYAARKRFD